ncbi:MAG: ATP-binding protein [Candidatus Scalinduaceae bacterium]
MSANPKILVVFREDENMKAAVKLLAEKGYDVFSKTSVFQAVATVAERKTDIVVLDIDDLELKEMEFFDVVKKINPKLFILVSFSFVNREKAIKSLESGADCYILKPFYINELLAIIHKFLDRTSHNGSILKESNGKQLSVKRMALRIAHEINNPLTTISGQLQLLLLGRINKDPNYPVYVTLEEETQRIAEAVRNLVTYAQLREPNKSFVNLNDIIKEVINFFKDTKQERDTQIIEAFDRDLPMIMADKEQISLVCKNIICNSQKAVGKKGVLKISTEKDNQNIIATFYDSGKGIPSKVIERIFDPFLVVDEAEGGIGLGLCVSHNIIKRHGGDLTVKSQEHKGTVFSFTLPLEPIKIL